jgi:hypothetical protein
MSLESDIDHLYQVPLEAYTAARIALASKVKGAGDAAAAARVKALEKPSVSAWAVNQLYWRARGDFDALVAAGNRLRRAQERSLRGGTGDLRAASLAKEQAVAAALAATIAHAEPGTGTLSNDIRRRIASTLESIAIQGGTGAKRAGRLVDDLPLPGFAALAALAPSRLTEDEPPGVPAPTAGGGAARPILGPRRSSRPAVARAADAQRRAEAARAQAREAERRARIERAQVELASAESDARAARQAEVQAAGAERDAAARVADARQATDEAKARLTEAMARATRALDEHRAAQQRAADAEAARKKADKTAAAAREALTKAQG